MTQPDLSQRLDSLIATWENEVAEFKQGRLHPHSCAR